MRLKFFSLTFSLCILGALTYAQDSSSTTNDSNLIGVMDSAQPTAVDSTQILKQQEKAGKISGQLARNRNKLADLEKDFAQKTVDKQKAIVQANESAEENRKAAIELSNDPSDRKKARRAQKMASRARRDTKSLQRADLNLKRLQKNIEKTKKQIENDEKDLAEVQNAK